MEPNANALHPTPHAAPQELTAVVLRTDNVPTTVPVNATYNSRAGGASGTLLAGSVLLHWPKLTDPGLLVKPRGQSVQEAMPTPLYEFAGHTRHAALLVEPVLLLKVPAVQSVQASSPAPLYVPGRHETHAVLLVEPVLLLKVPAGQLVHAVVVESVASLKVPLGQAPQVVPVGYKVWPPPAGHATPARPPALVSPPATVPCM